MPGVARSALGCGRIVAHRRAARPFARPSAVIAASSSRYSERHSGGSGAPSVNNSHEPSDVGAFTAKSQPSDPTRRAVRVLHERSIPRGAAGSSAPCHSIPMTSRRLLLLVEGLTSLLGVVGLVAWGSYHVWAQT